MLVVVEVKKQGEDMDSAVSHGLSYVEWLFKYRERVKKLNCEMAAAYIDPGWIKDENISIKGINPFYSILSLFTVISYPSRS